MGSVFVHYAIEAAPLAVILYALVWRLMGHPLRLARSWHVIGATTVALGAGAMRLATAYVLSGRTMQDLWTHQGVGLIGPVGVPVVISIGVVVFLRTRSRPVSSSD